MANYYGSDLARFVDSAGNVDISPTLAQATGIDVLIQSLISRQVCGVGSIIDAKKAKTIDLRALLKNGMTQKELGAIPTTVQKCLQDDQRVLSATVTGRFDTETKKLYLTEVVTPVNGGPFTLTLAVSELTVELINQ